MQVTTKVYEEKGILRVPVIEDIHENEKHLIAYHLWIFILPYFMPAIRIFLQRPSFIAQTARMSDK